MTLAMTWKILFYAWFASEIYVAIMTRTRRSGGKVQDGGSLYVLWVVITASITACEWIAAANPPTMFGGAHWVRVLALVVLVVGLTIRWVAILSLGRSFSSNVAIHDSQRMHKAGLYRFARHPSYSGLLLIFVAIGLHARNWMSLASVILPTTAALLYRIHVEELALRDAFGEEYVAYSRATKRLVPGLY
jgi:protein-S-isoprenylcysteine O-methyltransferase Ste14